MAGGLTSDSKNNTNTSTPWSLVKPNRLISNCYVVSSIGCAANLNDGFGGLHFSAQGYRDFGKRYADSILVAFRKLGTGPTSVKQGQGNAAQNGFDIGSGVEFKSGKAIFSFQIPKAAFVSLKAYTLSGKELAELAKAEYTAGKHRLELSRNVMRTGVYVLKMNSGTFSASRTIAITQ